MLQTSHIYCGDNLRKLPELGDASVDLIYIDPPFNTGADYEIIWKENGERRSFEDRFGETEKYIKWLRPRAAELRRALKPTGSFFVHCDPHENYAIRALLQGELGLRFRNEIVWPRSNRQKTPRRLSWSHDTILFFTRGAKFTWNPPPGQPLDEGYVQRHYRHADERGRRFKLGELTAPGVRHGDSGAVWRGRDVSAIGRHWATTRDKLDDLDRAGLIYWPKKEGAFPRKVVYFDPKRRPPLGDVWDDIAPLNMKAAERIGFPTQKPLALLERVIGMSSNKGDVVLDAFCGCGTALVAAAQLKRKWIGIDQSPTACRVVAERLFRDLRLSEGRDFFVRDVPKDEAALKIMEPMDFQNWAITAVAGIPNAKKVHDKGIDGKLKLVNAEIPKQVQGLLIFAKPKGYAFDLFEDSIPIQVKQREVTRPDVDAFETALRRAQKKVGIMIGFRFTDGAVKEIARAQREDHLKIFNWTVREILEQQAAA